MPQKVRMTIYPDILTEESIEVPIVAVNMPTGKMLRTFPSKVKLSFTVGGSRFRNIRPEQFMVVADYNDIANHPSDKMSCQVASVSRWHSPPKATDVTGRLSRRATIKDVNLMERALQRFAITGGIGSGKSYVCHLLEKRGISVYDCDEAAKRLMRSDKSLQMMLQHLIGGDVCRNGIIEKRVLAAFLLENDAHKQAVNDIVHPAVATDFMLSNLQWLESAILSKAVSITE